MKAIKKILVISSCLFFIYGCKNDTFDISEHAKLLDNPSDIFEKIELIQLETNDSVLIGNIGKIQLADSFIYILDKKQDCIFIFDVDGRYRKKLSRKGKGPGEYMSISDFEVDDGENIEVLGYYQLFLYDKNLDFKKSITLPEVSHYFSRIDKDNVALYHMAAENRLSVFNTETNSVICSDFKTFKNSNLLPINQYKSPFYRYNDEIYIKHTFTNNIMRIFNNKIEKYSTIFPSYNVDFSNLPNNKTKTFYRTYYINNSNPFITTAFQNNKIIQAYCKVKENGFYYIKNIKSNDSYYFGWIDSLRYQGTYINDSITYGFLGIDEALKYYNNFDLNKLISKSNIQNISLSDNNINPVIVKYFFR